jgi:hypothetical protein
MVYAVVDSIRDAMVNRWSPDHETDAAEALHYLLHETRWAAREYRRLNFREFLDHLKEFRRAARDEGLRTSGQSKMGGPPGAIDQRHWIDAGIDPATANTPHGVRTRSSLLPYARPQEYLTVFARTGDMMRIWPRASAIERAWSEIYVLLKRFYYLWKCQWQTIEDNVQDDRSLVLQQLQRLNANCRKALQEERRCRLPRRDVVAQIVLIFPYPNPLQHPR